MSNNEHQLFIKWCIILEKILKFKEEKVFQHLLIPCILRIVLDKKLSQNLRKRYTEILFEFDFLQIPELRQFINKILHALRINKLPEELDFKELIDILDKEIVNPKIVWTENTSKKMVDNLLHLIQLTKKTEIRGNALTLKSEIESGMERKISGNQLIINKMPKDKPRLSFQNLERKNSDPSDNVKEPSSARKSFRIKKIDLENDVDNTKL